jgi:hypothetical protein
LHQSFAMTKPTTRIVSAILAFGIAALIVGQRQSKVKLREDAQYLREQSERLSGLTAENARLSNLVAQTRFPEPRPNAPALELLRLRSEVARLRQDHDQVERLHKEIENLRRENRNLRGPTWREMQGSGGLDTNSLPDIEMGATKDEVSAELRRVGAEILTTAAEKFIIAQAFSAVLTSSNGAVVEIKMEFYFNEDGKLSMRTESPTFPIASVPR